MPRLHRHLFVLCLTLFSLSGSTSSAEENKPAQKPAEKDGATVAEEEIRTKEAVAAIQTVLDRHNLLLSTDEASVSKEFTMEVRLSLPTKAGKGLITDLRIARRGERVAVVVQAADGLPYCFLTNGLIVVFDREEPGRLAIHEDSSPVFILEGKGGEAMDFTFSHRKGNRAAVRYDPDSLLRAMLAKLRSATYDGASGAIMLRTDKSRVLLSLPPKPADGVPALDRLAVLGSAGTSITVTGVSTKAEHWDQVLDVTKESLQALGLQIRALRTEEVARLIPLVPADFASRPAERRAAEKLKVALRTDPPKSKVIEPATPPREPPGR